MPNIEDVDYDARGFTRAVLMYSSREPSPIVLDRTLESLAGVRKYVAETGLTSDMLISYLVMVALTVRGKDTDIDALEPWAVTLDEFEKRLRAAPVQGDPWPQTTVMTVYIKSSEQLDGKKTFGRALAAIESRMDLTQKVIEPDDPDADYATWKWIADSNELRIDAQVGEVVFTFPVPATDPHLISAHVAKELARFVQALEARSAYAFALDRPEYMRYLRGGFASGLPMWVFTFDGSTLSVHEGTFKNALELVD
jgi:hypothetical protein